MSMVTNDCHNNNKTSNLNIDNPIGLVKTESGFIVRSVETGLGR